MAGVIDVYASNMKTPTIVVKRKETYFMFKVRTCQKLSKAEDIRHNQILQYIPGVCLHGNANIHKKIQGYCMHRTKGTSPHTKVKMEKFREVCAALLTSYAVCVLLLFPCVYKRMQILLKYTQLYIA